MTDEEKRDKQAWRLILEFEKILADTPEEKSLLVAAVKFLKSLFSRSQD